MIIVLEGVSAVGKTTLANHMAEELDAEIFHVGAPPKDDPFGWYLEGVNAAYDRSHSLILDRFHLSNYVYRDMFSGGIMSMQQFLQLDKMLAQMDAWLFLMVDDPFAIEERVRGRAREGDPGLTLSRQQFGELQQRFFEAFDLSRIANKGSFRFNQFIEHNGAWSEQFNDIISTLKETRD